MNDINDLMQDMKMSMEILPMMASAIRKLRMQKIAEEQKKVQQPITVPESKPQYQQNKWEVSPSG